MDGPGDPSDQLRIASSQRLSIVDHGRDPADEPLADGTPRPALTSIMLHTDGDQVTATATLALHGRVLSGCHAGDASDRALVVAEATLKAIHSLLHTHAVVESSQVVEIEGREISLTILQLQRSPDGPARRFDVLVGSALVRGDAEDATARSVLSALNRRLGT